MELTRIKNKDINSQYIFKKQIKHAAFFDENIYLHIYLFYLHIIVIPLLL
jgi:hypothetical protein